MRKISTIAELGAVVRDIRKGQGVSQDTLSGLAGTGQRYVSELERGKETIRLKELLKLLEALGASLYLADPQEKPE